MKAGEPMPSGKEYFESLGLEIAKRKYYNAAKVESVIGEFSRRAAALEEENASLRKRVEALACGREEIGEAILSAKTISQQLIAEAKEQAETILADARAEAGRLTAEAEERSRALAAAAEEREQRTIRAAQESYLQLRGQCQSAVKLLDGEWQRFLCSFGDELPAKEEALPGDFADRLGALAACLAEMDEENTERDFEQEDESMKELRTLDDREMENVSGGLAPAQAVMESAIKKIRKAGKDAELIKTIRKNDDRRKA